MSNFSAIVSVAFPIYTSPLPLVYATYSPAESPGLLDDTISSVLKLNSPFPDVKPDGVKLILVLPPEPNVSASNFPRAFILPTELTSTFFASAKNPSGKSF